MITVLAPDYFPGYEYMAIARRCECVVLADTYQYSRQSYQNRARLRTPQGWQWMTVPLDGRQHGRPILATTIDPRKQWAGQHRRSVQYNYSSAPFYDYYIDRLHAIWDGEWRCLADLTCASVEVLLRALSSEVEVMRASVLPGAPADLPAIARVLGREEIAMTRGRYRHDGRLVRDPHVITIEPISYAQNFAGFVPGMSALDVLFNHGPEAGRLIDGCIVRVDRPR